MRQYTRKNVKIINEIDGEVFEERLNDFLDKLADGKVAYELKFNDNLGLCAYVIYSIVETVPETASEKAMINGEGRICGDCRYYEFPMSGNKKYTICSKQNARVHFGSCCCDAFYENGYIKPSVVCDEIEGVL